MPTLQLKPGKQHRIRAGHPWVYASQAASVSDDASDGDPVVVVDSRGRALGTGFLNRKSQIITKLLAHADVAIDEAFLRDRILRAVRYREDVLGFHDVYRAVYSEGDLLPGLIVDRYDDRLVLQALTLGMDRRKALIAEILQDALGPAAIFERSDAPVRRYEGLEPSVGFLSGCGDTEFEIEWAGMRMQVDIAGGQKTGLFLDQRENLDRLATFAPGRSVLDAFCYNGAFGIRLAMAGASGVTGIEASGDALATAAGNAKRNGVEAACSWTEANAFDELKRLATDGSRFDLVVLDPPTFCRGREAVEGALRGYKEINLRALRMLRPGGILATASCSYHVNLEMFLDVIADAAADAHRVVRLVEDRGQSRDHPDLLAMPETRYLKFVVLQVVE